jgi:hypothetical protein
MFIRDVQPTERLFHRGARAHPQVNDRRVPTATARRLLDVRPHLVVSLLDQFVAPSTKVILSGALDFDRLVPFTVGLDVVLGRIDYWEPRAGIHSS